MARTDLEGGRVSISDWFATSSSRFRYNALKPAFGGMGGGMGTVLLPWSWDALQKNKFKNPDLGYV